MTLDAIIRSVQGHLGLQVDGKAGPLTWSAIYRSLVAPEVQPEAVLDRVDDRSEAHIATLHPRVQPFARALVQQAAAQGLNVKIISGTRSYDEQDKLYAQGRSLPGPKVTNAPGGYSNHNFGLAFDVGVFQGSKYLAESPQYDAVASLGQALGLEWGGSWKSPVDKPHYQLRPTWARDMTQSQMLRELRRRKQANIDAFAP